MTYRLEAKLRGYIHGVFPTKLSELENDVPYVSAADGQELTDGQQRAALENVNATEILAENFVRHDVATELSEEAQKVARDNIGTYGKAEIDERIGNIKIDFLEDANKYADEKVGELAERTAASLQRINEEIGDEEYQGFDTPPTSIKNAINKLAKRKPDGETIVEADDIISAVAIKDETSDGEKTVTPQTIVDLEKAAIKIAADVDRLKGRGGFLTPYNFEWDGVSESVQVGDTFNESRNGVKTEITVVADGSGNYPTGTNINLTDAYKKAVDWQIDLMDWATFDIWGAINRKYGTEGLDEVAEGQRITLSVKSVTAQTEPFCEIFGTDADGNSYGVYQQDGKFYFGSFTYDTELQTVTAVESDELWDGVSALKPFRKDYRAPKGIVLNASIERPFGGDSGLSWEENLIVWEKDFYEIFNGTRVINEFNNWEMELTNTQDTEPPVCSWATASIDQEINYADDDTGGIVRTGQTRGEGASRVYGVQLDDITKQMYVSELGEDLAEITQSVEDKVEKATGAVENNIAVFDSNGGIKDNNIKASDFATAAQGALADSAYQKPSGGIPNTDLAQGVRNSLGLADSALQGITAGNNITIDTRDPKRPVINSTGGGISEIEPLTIQLNGTGGVVFDGSEAQSVNITAAGVGAEPTIATKGTAFNKDFGTTAGTVMEGNDSRVAGAVQSVTFAGTELTKTDGAAEITQSEARSALGLGSAAYTASTAYATAAQGALADSAYQKPSGGIPATDLAQGVRDSLALADSALQSVPDATATQKGVATLGAAGGAARYGQKNDVGLGNVDNVKQYSASNPPPYPVTSVAGRTGAVTLTKADVELDNVANERQYSANNPPPYPVTSVAGKTGVVTLEKADVGLGNVDNTADLDKPVSTATQTALNAKIGNTGTQSIAGNLTLVADSGGNGNLVVQGDLTVQGTTITEEHETLNVVDNLIVTNSEGASLTDLSGVAIKKNETDTYGVLYDPVSDSVKLGLGTIDAEGDFAFNPGEGKPVTIRDDSANLTDGHLLEWDSTENKVVDGGAKPTALPNPHALTLGSKVYNGSSDVTLLASDINAEPAFAKNTAFNKNFGTSADTVAQGNDSRIVSAVQSAMFSGVALEKSGTQLSISQESARTALGLGTAAYTNVGDNVVDVGAVAGLPAPATGQVSLTVSEEIASRIRDNEDSIIKVRLLLPESTSEGTVIYLRRNTNMWVDVSQDMDIWSCMLDVSMYEGHEVVAISYMAAFNPSSDAPTLLIQAIEIRNGAKVVDIGQISLNFMETGDASVNITNEQYDALEDVDRTILKFSTSDGQNIYLNGFCLGNGIIYSAMIAESGIVAAYTANIGGSSQKTVAIRASAVYGGTEGNIATVIDIGTVANFSFAEEGNWTVNISDEMYSKITAQSQETTQIKFADASGNVAYLTRYVDNDGSLIFTSTYTDASQVTLIQLFADVRGWAGNYKIEIACTMSLLGPHPQFIDIGVVQGFEVGVEGAWSVNISDTIYNKIAEGEDVRIVISDTNTASVIMPQVQTIQGKKGFGTSFPLDQNGGRIEYVAGTSGVPGDYRLEIVAIVPDVGGGGGVEVVNLGTPTFKEANGGQYLLANVTLTSEQAAKIKAEPAPVVKFTLSGANGDYQNGAYYLTKTYLMSVDLHMYNTCFQVQDNGGWAITLQTVGTLSAIITIYPYYIPQVEANPSENAGVTLEKLKVGNTIYAIPQGEAATIEVGEVTTGAAGTQASVTNSGTENAAVFDFTIPKGADGASGVTDVTAGTPTEQDGYTVTPVTFNFEQGNNKTVEVKAKNGADGAGGGEVTKEAIATALNLSTTQLDVLVSLAQKVTITGNDVKFATGTVLKSSFFDAVD